MDVRAGRKEVWMPKKLCFQIVVLEKTLESPLGSKEIKPVKINPEYSLEGLMLKLKLHYFDHLLQRADSLEKTLMLGKTEGKRIRGWQRMKLLDSIINSMDMNLSKFQETVKDREAWSASVHGVTKSRTQCSNWTTIATSLLTLKKSNSSNRGIFLIIIKKKKKIEALFL